MKLSALRSLVVLLVLSFVAEVSARIWTSKDGRKLEAELVEYDAAGGKVRIKRADGREFTLAQDKLSDEDVAYLKELEAEKEKQRVAAKAMAEERAGKFTSHTSSGEHEVPFHVYYPKSYDGSRKLPMMILFSPGGGGKGMANKFTSCADEVGWILVGCDKFKNGMDEELGVAMFTELLPEIEKTVAHAPEFLYMGGFSGGAYRSYEYSAKFDRPWKGIVACGGWIGGGERLDMKFAKGMSIAMLNGKGDKAANSWVDRDTDALEGRGCEVRVFECEGGHVVAPPEILLQAVQWIKGEQEGG